MKSSQASRHYHATASTSKDWSSAQYLKFNAERTRPARDLLSQVYLESPPKHVVDLGCGPANSTEVLLERFPDANISGIDSSADMIKKAKATLPQVDFALGDLHTYQSEKPVDLFFCNAVLQWIPHDERIGMVTRLIESQPSGGVFAFQVPNNLAEPSHEAMNIAAADGSWTKFYNGQLPQRTKVQTPQELYDQLGPYCSSVDVWQTEYQHVLDSHQDVVEWVKGTGLRPFINPLPEEEREAFLARYLEELTKAYPVSYDGKVLFKFPRLFVVAVRK
ncbi:trans-aconitate 2-methyltransferase [Mariannaea sp. PMI_226]|nr:trans-aconitate 2-methyltransferase [Mariannaea sp. PMI_226]